VAKALIGPAAAKLLTKDEARRVYWDVRYFPLGGREHVLLAFSRGVVIQIF
jgi:hypothetical protein